MLNSFVSWIASEEAFILEDLSISFSILIIWYALTVLLFKWFERKRYYRLVLLLVSVIALSSVLILERYNAESSNEFIIFHKNKESVIGLRNGKTFKVYSKDSLVMNTNFVKDYYKENSINNSSSSDVSQKLFGFNNEKILVVDSSSIFQYKTIKPSIVLLKNSPKINFEYLCKLFKQPGYDGLGI